MSSGRKTYKSVYKPINEDKYVGNVDKIICRSHWERLFAKYLDHNTNVKKWSSEEIVIPYVSPKDGKVHRYFVDFMVLFVDGMKLLVEIKPYNQTIPPPEKSRKTASYKEALLTYAINQAKWEAAREWCAKNNVVFQVFTENELRRVGIPIFSGGLGPKK